MTERDGDATCAAAAATGPAGAAAGHAPTVPNPYTSPTLDADARNAALRALFLNDPHFRHHDGLDVGVDEVAALEASPQARRQTILRARAFGLLDDDLLDQADPSADGLPDGDPPGLPADDGR